MNRFCRFFGLLTFALILLQGRAIGDDDLVLIPRDASVYLGNKVRYLHSESKLEVDRVLPLIKREALQSVDVPNSGYKKGEHWYHLRVTSGDGGRYHLSYEYPLMQRISVFILADGIVVDERSGGKLAPVIEREVRDRNHVFTFDFSAGKLYTVLIRLETTGAVNLPLKIYSERDYASAKGDTSFLFALYFGALLALILYNLFLWLSIGQSSYLFYSCYLIFIGLVHFFLFGFANLYFFPGGGYFNTVGTVVSTGFSFLFLTIFAATYLNIERNTKLFKGLILPAISLNILVVVLGSCFYGTLAIRLTGLTAILTPLAILTLSIVCIKSGKVEARFLFAGMISFIIGSFMYGMKDYALIPKNYITEHGAAVGTAIEAVLLSLGLAYRYRTVVKENTSLEFLNAKNSAISSMVSAIAHDVRKPFSMFKMLMDAIRTINEPSEIREFATSSLPEVQRAIDNVEGLLLDVMQVNSVAVLSTEVVSAEQVLTGVLEQTFRGQPEADVEIVNQLGSNITLNVDLHKSQRIFANIIGNACQAIGWRGEIWIKAIKNFDRVQFTLGNAGSYIPSESLSELFEAFYTSNKRGGTGLGLAIAKKWTTAHGGTISCHSEKNSKYPEGMVEFTFDLPSGGTVEDLRRPKLHNHSSHYRLELGLESRRKEDEALEHLTSSLQGRLRQLERPLQLLAIDDEQLYLAGIKKTLEKLQLGDGVSLTTITKPDQKLYGQTNLLLIDFDLSLPSVNGLDVVREFKHLNPKGFVCLHTNRTDAALFRDAISAGADAVYTKPITPEHLGKLLLEVVSSNHPYTRELNETSNKIESKKLRIAFVDDSITMRKVWKMALETESSLSIFKSPEEIIAAGKKFEVVVTDMNFDNSMQSGADVARWSRVNNPQSLVLLCSGEDNCDPHLFDGRVPKDRPPRLEDLHELLLKAKNRQQLT